MLQVFENSMGYSNKKAGIKNFKPFNLYAGVISILVKGLKRTEKSKSHSNIEFDCLKLGWIERESKVTRQKKCKPLFKIFFLGTGQHGSPRSVNR